MKINFTETGWKDYLFWEEQDKRVLKQINKLITDIERNGYDGIGKPEQLRSDLSGWWSRRIDEKNRLVYRIIDDEAVEISQCKGHYGDK
ncbi:MAG: Txe/YoeB family addiction module toxin [Treponema sp.]|nr:Txe/YoeB family addiction module toxin [Treponema sp.]